MIRTFAPGAGGAGVTSESIVTVCCVAPVPITSSSPGPRPAVLCSRIAVAPAAAAALRVVFTVVPRETLPELSMARMRSVVLPSSERSTLAETDPPPVIGASAYVAPPSVEYWSFATATSSVAARSSVCGTVSRQPPLPSGGSANAAVVMTGGAVSAARAGAAGASTAAAATAIRSRVLDGPANFLPIPFPLLTSLTERLSALPSPAISTASEQKTQGVAPDAGLAHRAPATGMRCRRASRVGPGCARHAPMNGDEQRAGQERGAREEARHQPRVARRAPVAGLGGAEDPPGVRARPAGSASAAGGRRPPRGAGRRPSPCARARSPRGASRAGGRA